MTFPFLALAMVAAVLLAAIPAFAQNPGIGAVDCNTVRANAQQTNNDPEGDVSGNGTPGCPSPVNYGFDYGSTAVWYDQVSGDLYFCVGLNGNVGDSDQDGGYDTKSVACGGHPACVTQESDIFHNIFAAQTEKMTWAFDRNCDGIDDLVFVLTGSTTGRADSVSVSLDFLPGHTSHVNDILGGRGVGWQGAPIQQNADVSCVADRNGAVILRIPGWKKYFTDDGLVSGNIIPGVSPTLFKWLVDSGNNSDLYNEDRVEDFFDISNPQIDIAKVATPTTLCEIGASTTFTITVTNTGNTALFNEVVTDQLPAGLSYTGGSGVPAPTSVVGGLITWSGLSIQPGANQIFTFSATKTADCQGVVTDTARVNADFNPDCYPARKIPPAQLSDEATFGISCIQPCVQINLPESSSACVGSGIDLPVTVTNCGTITEDFVVQYSIGGVAQTPKVFNGVEGGGQRSFNATVNCAAPGNVSVTASVVATAVGFPACTANANTGGVVNCHQACVTVDVPAVTDVCVGDTKQIPINVVNCGTEAENFTFTATVGGVPVVIPPLDNVEAGGQRSFNIPVTCTDPGQVTVAVTANALVVSAPACSTSNNDSGVVNCLQACATVNVPDNTNTCVNQKVNVTVTVANCSNRTEDLTVPYSVGGVAQAPKSFPGVAAGANRTFDVSVNSGVVGDVAISATVNATFSEAPSCTASATDGGTVHVQQACVQVDVPTDTKTCVGTPVNVPVDVTNCGSLAENFTLNVSVDGVPRPPVTGTIGAGEKQTFQVDVSCAGPGTRTVAASVDVSVVGFESCTGNANDSGTVTCQQACVEINLTDNLSTCVGTPINVPGTVKNCGLFAEDITVTRSVNGVAQAPVQFDNVQPGETKNFEVSVACAEAGTSNVAANATANVVGAPACSTSLGDNTTVACHQACVTVDVPATTDICVGDNKNIPISVVNCGTEPENFTFTGTVGGVPIVIAPINNVEAGGQRSFNVNVSCTDPGQLTVAIQATASVVSAPACSTSNNDSGVVNCVQACAQINVPDNTNTCVGQKANVTVTVTNCSSRTEDFSVPYSVGGVAQIAKSFLAVPAGEFRTFDVSVNSGVVGDVAISATVNATFSAAPSCTASATDGGTVHVQQACVQVDVPANTTTCVGTPVNVPVDVTNCGTLAENFTLNVSVDGVARPPITGSIGAGQKQTFQIEVACAGPGTRTVSASVSVTVVGFETCTGSANDEGTVTCQQACASINVPDNTNACVGQKVNVPVSVTNCGTATEDLHVTYTVKGVAGSPQDFANVPAGGVRNFNISVTCSQAEVVAISATVDAKVTAAPACTTSATDGGNVTCSQACVNIVPTTPSQSICVGGTAQVPFTVTNCGTGNEDIIVSSKIDNGVPSTTTFLNVGPGETKSFNVPVVCSGPGSHTVSATANATAVGNTECTDSKTASADVTCLNPDIDITKTTTPTTTQDCSTVTIVVKNTGTSNLDPVQIHDCFPTGLSFDQNQTIGGTCNTTLDHVSAAPGGFTCIYFKPITLAPAASCTLSYKLCCTQFDNAARVDTATVVAYCQGTFNQPGSHGVVDTDTALVVCKQNIKACTHTIGFWRAQCAQKPNGSTKICRAGMEALWRCVINTSKVVMFKKNDGSFESRASLAALSNSALFDKMCSQLDGPRPMTIRDMTELQYLGVMLAVCTGSLPLNTPVQGGGTIADAIAGIENAINTNTNLGYWEGVADAINNGGVLAAPCDDPDFRNLPQCAGPAAGRKDIDGDLTVASLETRAYPNPVRQSTTTIYYGIPSSLGDSQVDILVFDIAGRVVKHLVSETKAPGQYTVDWNLTDESGSQVSSGIFFYRLTVGGESVTQKMMVLRK